jgi:hypothetical protein
LFFFFVFLDCVTMKPPPSMEATRAPISSDIYRVSFTYSWVELTDDCLEYYLAAAIFGNST